MRFHCPQDIKNELSKYNGIVMHGQLSDAQLDYLYASVRVAVAPLVSGAGVKGKVRSSSPCNRFVAATFPGSLAPLVHIRNTSDDQTPFVRYTVVQQVNQAMALGVPVVATTIAVEGMHAVSGHDCMVAHTLEELVQHLHQVSCQHACS